VTKPTITYGHGKLAECESTDDWDTLVESDVTLSTSKTCENSDWLKLHITCKAVADEWVYTETDIADKISSSTYTKFLVRYKTSESSNGCGAKVVLVFVSDVTGAVADDGGATTDETTEATNATANDMTLLPAVPAVNDAYYFGGDATFEGVDLNIGTAGAGVWTITWEYWNGAAWTALSGVKDNTDGFTAAAGPHSVTFTVPSDWATTTVGGIATKYWVRGRVSAYTSITTQPKGTQTWTEDSTQTVVGDPNPVFSTAWAVASGDITSGKNIGKIRVYADDYPDTLDSGTHHVYYDFILLFKDLFTFPALSGSLELEVANTYADIPIPSRLVDVTQYLGAPAALVRLEGEMDSNTSWGTPDGQYLYLIMQEACSDPWQYFTSDMANFKITPRIFRLRQDHAAKAPRTFYFEAKEYRASSGSTESDLDRFGV